jgi:hypothetical protein
MDDYMSDTFIATMEAKEPKRPKKAVPPPQPKSKREIEQEMRAVAREGLSTPIDSRYRLSYMYLRLTISHLTLSVQ